MNDTGVNRLAMFYAIKVIKLISNDAIKNLAVTVLQFYAEQVMKQAFYFVQLKLFVLVSTNVLKN